MAPPSPKKSSRPNDKATPEPEREGEGVDEAQDPLERLIRQRQRAAHKERRSRDAYAFGVDVRRTRWFVQHRLFGAGLRTVERQWHARWTQLRATTLDTTTAPTTATLAELARCVRILGAPVPTVWCLNEEASLSGQWPTITPLGTSHGDMHHLLLDTQGLEALDDAERRFLMGSALGHLQCDHGIMFTTCLLARGPDAPRWTRALRRGLQPAMKLMCFSADRAGLLCSESLDAAMEGMRHHVAESRSAGTQWMPTPSSYDLRVTSLREFHQSDVYARVRGARAARHRDLTMDPVPGSTRPQHVPDDAWSVARVDQRLTRRLGLL